MEWDDDRRKFVFRGVMGLLLKKVFTNEDRYKKRIVLIAIMVMISLLLSNCTSKEEKAKARNLVKTYSRSFKDQAKEEYGSKAKVTGIKADYDTSFGGVWPDIKNSTNGMLRGTITIGGESFEAKYITDENIIITQRNYDKIINSLTDYFAYLELEIVGGKIVDDTRNKWYLPEHIKTFEDMLLDKSYMFTIVLTTSDIEHLTREDFSKLEINGSLTFVQIGDRTDIDELFKYLGSTDFASDRYPQTHIPRYSGDTVDAFDYFDIRSSVYVSDTIFPYFNYLKK